jgi:hypothetical protein
VDEAVLDVRVASEAATRSIPVAGEARVVAPDAELTCGILEVELRWPTTQDTLASHQVDPVSGWTSDAVGITTLSACSAGLVATRTGLNSCDCVYCVVL